MELISSLYSRYIKVGWLKYLTSLILFSSYILTIDVKAQYNGLPKVAPPAPDATALGKYGDIPVGYYTGIPSITIPLHEIVVDDVVIPVTLTYHSGGFKIEEIASNTGLGWSLNAGGIVTGVVRGLYDFRRDNKGFVRSYDVLPSSPLNPVQFGQILQPDYELCKRIATGDLDSEPDLFFYNYLGKSGKFYFDAQGNTHTIPFNKSKISFFQNEEYFLIKDEQGNSFTFSKKESNISNSSPGCPTSSGGYLEYSQENLSYYLDKITTVYKNSVEFIYEDIQYSYENSNVEQDFIKYATPLGLCDQTPPKNPCNPISLVLGKRLKKILVPKQQLTVEFVYSNDTRLDLPGTYPLSSIIVKRSNDPIKTFILSYDYFISPGVSSAPINQVKNYYRLKLVRVLEVGKEPYEFEYNSTILPHRFSKAQDWWGYYNGEISATSLLPECEINDNAPLVGTGPRTIAGAKRLPNKDFMIACILSKIKYPTGGQTIFEFEPHDTYKEKETVTWSYNGRTVSIAQDESNTYSQTFEVLPTYSNRRNYRIKYSNSTPGLTNTVQVYISGPNNYNRVFEGACPPDGIPLRFESGGTYQINIYGEGTHGAEYATISWEDKSAEQQNQNFISGGLRVRKIVNTSMLSPSGTKVFEYRKLDQPLKSSGLQMHDLDSRFFIQDTYFPRIIPSSEAQTEYTLCRNLVRYGTSPISLGQLNGSSVAYEFVTVKELDAIGNENGKTEYCYFTVNDGARYWEYPYPFPTDYDWMRGHIKFEKTYRKNAGENYTLLKEVYTTYNFNHSYGIYNPTNANEHIINYPKVSNRNTAFDLQNNFGATVQILADFAIEYSHMISAWIYKSKDSVILYDQFGELSLTSETIFKYENALHSQLTSVETRNSKDDVVKTQFKYPHDFSGSMIYDTMIARNIISPVIETRRIKNDVLLTTEKVDYELWSVDKLALRKKIRRSSFNFPFEPEIVFNEYDNKGNILQYTSKDGIVTSFVWGYQKNYPVAKIIGATYQEILSALDQSDHELSYLQELDENDLIIELNKIRNNLKVNKPQAEVTTFTYIPLVGLKTFTNNFGLTTSYEYDSLGRLIRIRDHDGNILKTFEYKYQEAQQ